MLIKTNVTSGILIDNNDNYLFSEIEEFVSQSLPLPLNIIAMQ